MDKMKKGDIITDDRAGYGCGIRHLQMGCMCLTMIALFIARGSMGVAVLAMTDTRRNNSKIEVYDWDKKTQGLILSSFFWGYILMQIPAGIIARRYGGKPVMLFSLLANGFVCGLLPSLVKVGDWKIVCACRMVMGLTQACLFPASHTMLGRWLPAHERTSYTGIVYSGPQIGIMIGMPLCGILSATAMGWKLIFYTISAIMFLQAAVWWYFAASTPGDHKMISKPEKEYIEKALNTARPKKFRTPWRCILTTKAFWAALVAHSGCSMVYVLFFTDMATYLERGLHISLSNSASLSALPYIGMLVGNVATSMVCERWYNKGTLRMVTLRRLFNSLGVVGATGGLLALSFVGGERPTAAIVILVVMHTMCGCFSATFTMSYLDLSPNYAGLMLSMGNSTTTIGGVLSPILTSIILNNDPTDLARWRIVFLLTAAVGVISNIVYVLFISADLQEWDDPNYREKKKGDPGVKPPLLSDEKISFKEILNKDED
ncbi:putative inorganic phosphate cotransporter isoform X2 [Leptidea sinapis]|uniref:putative inorganic phosphate cotransporter isoform X2 n=1 Tax=Leptidea sinapis TaxID=189913 RepID=UPI0021C44A86|nr:putative inorganic phosphate cotransporter isoform X2 [Leptidea sinapis]